MAVDPRTPVLIGTGQLSQRVDRGAPPLEPVDLIVEAAHAAGADAGAASGSPLEGLDSIRIVSIFSWRYRNPALLVAERIGVSPRHLACSTPGGNSPQALVNGAAVDIAAGRADAVLIAGAEAWRTRTDFRSSGNSKPPWTEEPDSTPPPEILGEELAMTHPGEAQRGLILPVQMYPIFETALRAAAGRTVDQHQRHISELWSRFAAVAAKNPHAWIQRAYTAEEIRTPGPDNRMIGFPYPKLMNSNNAVEQSAALLLCSAERADALGVPRDRWVFPLSGSDAHDSKFVSNRVDLHSSPAIRIAGRDALAGAGIGADDLAHVDLYSCFPSAVQIAANELGLSTDRDLTVTGGLCFAGGPWNNYVTHAIATMAGVLREDPGSFGLCSANGGFVTKHSIGVYSTTPPAHGFRTTAPQHEVDLYGSKESAEDASGPVTVEGYVVMHDRDGEVQNGIAAVLTGDGRRAWGTTTDAAVLKAMTEEEFVGRPANLAADGELSFQ